MSPSDLGEILKPFVFLDLFHHEGEPFSAPLHPHSGIATLTYVVEGAVSYIARGITDGRYENLFVGRTVLPGLLEEVKAIFKEALIPTLQEPVAKRYLSTDRQRRHRTSKSVQKLAS